jgi:hypothetical protein
LAAQQLTLTCSLLRCKAFSSQVYPCELAHIPTAKAPEKDGAKGTGGVWFVRLLAAAVAASLVFAAQAPAYTEARPKRLIFQAVTREVFALGGALVARDAGVWVNGMDFIHPHPLLVEWLADSPLAHAVKHAQVRCHAQPLGQSGYEQGLGAIN